MCPRRGEPSRADRTSSSSPDRSHTMSSGWTASGSGSRDAPGTVGPAGGIGGPESGGPPPGGPSVGGGSDSSGPRGFSSRRSNCLSMSAWQPSRPTRRNRSSKSACEKALNGLLSSPGLAWRMVVIQNFMRQVAAPNDIFSSMERMSRRSQVMASAPDCPSSRVRSARMSASHSSKCSRV
jgi:hypothetical protein